MPKVSKFRLGSVEERLLEPVIRLEIMPAEIPPFRTSRGFLIAAVKL